MTSMTFPASGPFGLFGGARKATTRRARSAKPTTVTAGVAKPVGEHKSTWTSFLGDAFATWATGGRLPR